MSSFLDSTGLSRLVSKITDYFAKKDGTYPNMTVGNVSNVVPIAKLPTASSVTNGDTTHVPTADAVYKTTREIFPDSWIDKGAQNPRKWKLIATSILFTNYNKGQITLIVAGDGYGEGANFGSIISASVRTGYGGALSIPNSAVDLYRFKDIQIDALMLRKGSTNQVELWVKANQPDTNVICKRLAVNNFTFNTVTDRPSQKTDDEMESYKATNPVLIATNKYMMLKTTSAVGNAWNPTYADANGALYGCKFQVTPFDSDHIFTPPASGAYLQLMANVASSAKTITNGLYLSEYVVINANSYKVIVYNNGHIVMS